MGSRNFPLENAAAERSGLSHPFDAVGIKWWPEVESNHRHGDFQSPALPTELSGLCTTYVEYVVLIFASPYPVGTLRLSSLESARALLNRRLRA